MTLLQNICATQNFESHYYLEMKHTINSDFEYYC